MAREISNSDDIIDSRDVIARIEELEEERAAIIEDSADVSDVEAQGQPCVEEAHNVALDTARALLDWDDDNGAELAALKSLANEAEGYAADWHHGSTLIRDSYFEDYARELAEDTGALTSAVEWPLTCIDWAQAARELQQDYTAVDFDGVTYWVR